MDLEVPDLELEALPLPGRCDDGDLVLYVPDGLDVRDVSSVVVRPGDVGPFAQTVRVTAARAGGGDGGVPLGAMPRTGAPPRFDPLTALSDEPKDGEGRPRCSTVPSSVEEAASFSCYTAPPSTGVRGGAPAPMDRKTLRLLTHGRAQEAAAGDPIDDVVFWITMAFSKFWHNAFSDKGDFVRTECRLLAQRLAESRELQKQTPRLAGLLADALKAAKVLRFDTTLHPLSKKTVESIVDSTRNISSARISAPWQHPTSQREIWLGVSVGVLLSAAGKASLRDWPAVPGHPGYFAVPACDIGRAVVLPLFRLWLSHLCAARGARREPFSARRDQASAFCAHISEMVGNGPQWLPYTLMQPCREREDELKSRELTARAAAQAGNGYAIQRQLRVLRGRRLKNAERLQLFHILLDLGMDKDWLKREAAMAYAEHYRKDPSKTKQQAKQDVNGILSTIDGCARRPRVGALRGIAEARASVAKATQG